MNEASKFVIDLLLTAINSPHATDAYISQLAIILNKPDELAWEIDQQVIDLLSEAYISYTYGFDYSEYPLRFRSPEQLLATAKALKSS